MQAQTGAETKDRIIIHDHLWHALQYLTTMFGDDDGAKAEFLDTHFPQLTPEMVMQFQKTVLEGMKAYYRDKE